MGKGENAGKKHCLLFLHIVFKHFKDRFNIFCYVYTFPKQQILDSFKRKEFADDKFKFDKYGRKFSKGVEKAVGKGEIRSQFLLYPQCLQKTCVADL